MRISQDRQAGQAAVEAALTLPLAVFMVLGVLQLFMMLQARLMTEHAAYRAVRAGSLSQGNCERMLHTAIALLLPTFTRTQTTAQLANQFGARRNNRYAPGRDSGHNGDIVWIQRERPDFGNIPAPEYSAFDDPDSPLSRLEVRMVFWYPMRIPFANWVIAAMVQSAWGLAPYTAQNPLLLTQQAEWTGSRPLPANMSGAVISSFMSRTGSPAGTYVFPIEATAAMRMMTPPRRAFFNPQHCR